MYIDKLKALLESTETLENVFTSDFPKESHSIRFRAYGERDNQRIRQLEAELYPLLIGKRFTTDNGLFLIENIQITTAGTGYTIPGYKISNTYILEVS